jgi:uncharacterized protein (TIGR01777 family)
MSTKILITGGTGLVGTRLSELLTQKEYEVVHLSRKPRPNAQYKTYTWDVMEGHIDKEALEVDYIIHLAGAGVADKKWTDQRKELIYSSRIESTRLLFEKVREHGISLKGFISASAIGYYGFDTGDQLVDETTKPGSDFLANVVIDWEDAADSFAELKIPVAKVRIGIVFSENGGALPQLVGPIRFGAGAPIGSGKQYMSWIHIDDLCRIFEHVVSQNLEGVFNGVGPQPATNKEVTKVAAAVLKKPLFLPNVPAFALKIAFGEMANIVLGGNKVASAKIEETGFQFEHPELKECLQDLLG